MLVQLLPPVSDYNEVFLTLFLFGTLYFFLWSSGEIKRAHGRLESIRVRKLRLRGNSKIGYEVD
jgi:hypothetical protein